MKSKRRRRLLVVVAACLLVSGLMGLAWRPMSKPVHPLKVATMEWPGYYSLMRAEVEGHLQTIPATLIIRPDNASINEAFSRHDAEVITMVLSDAVLLAADGVDLRIIAVLDYSDQSDVLLAQPEFTTVMDLRGQEIACDGVQTFSHVFVLDVLTRGGLPESVVTFRDLPAMQVPNAVLTGRLAAGYTWGPLAAAAVARGCHILAKAGDDPGMITEVMVTHADTLVHQRDQLQVLMSTIWESVDRSKTDEAGTIAAAASCLKKKPDEIDPLTGTVHLWNQAESLACLRGEAQPSLPARIAHLVAQFRQRGQVQPNFTAEHLIDTSLYQQGPLVSSPLVSSPLSLPSLRHTPPSQSHQP